NRRLKSATEKKNELLKARDKEIENLKAHMVLKEVGAAEAIRLRAEASNFVTVKKSLQDEVNVVNEHSTILEKEWDALDVKVADLEASVVKFRKLLSVIMSAITDVRCVLTHEALDTFCNTFHIPEEVHPVLPNQDDTMHERPTKKIELYTRFFDFANFKFPLSTFLVDILRHFRINISQLSVIGAAMVSHFEILCRVYGIVPTVGLFWCFYVNSKKSGWMSFSKRSDNVAVCYTKPLDSLKNWNNRFFWVDDFACLASFPWHTVKHVIRDPAPAAVDFSAQDYATLVTHPSPFRKFLESFLCLVGLSRHYTLDEETYLRFVHKNGENMDLFVFIHALNPTKVRVVETTGGYLIKVVVVPKRSKGIPLAGVSYPPKKLREDHETPSGTSVGDKSRSSLQSLLAGAMFNVEVGVTAAPTFPFLTAYVSTTPEREDEGHTNSIAEPNLRTIGAPQRFVISSDSSYHFGPTIAKVEVDSLVRSSTPVTKTATTVTSMVDSALVAKEKTVKPSLFFTDSSSVGGAYPDTSVFWILLHITNGSPLDDGRVYHEMVAPLKFFASVRGMEHDQLFIEFNVGAARHMSLSAEVRMQAEYNIKERRRLKSVVEEKDELLKAKDEDIENLKAQMLLKEAEATEAIRLRAEASNFKIVEKSRRDEVSALKERIIILEKERNALDVKVAYLEASVVGKERDLTGLNAQLTFVKSQNDTLVDQVHELELSSSGLQEKVTMEAIGKSIEKGMHDGLSAGITHGKEGGVLTNVAAYNPSTEVDYFSCNSSKTWIFPLLVELKSHKDASIEAILNVLRWKIPLRTS
nr:hypothetical protein [Tanacetum cinerariifolium]